MTLHRQRSLTLCKVLLAPVSIQCRGKHLLPPGTLLILPTSQQGLDCIHILQIRNLGKHNLSQVTKLVSGRAKLPTMLFISRVYIPIKTGAWVHSWLPQPKEMGMLHRDPQWRVQYGYRAHWIQVDEQDQRTEAIRSVATDGRSTVLHPSTFDQELISHNHWTCSENLPDAH